MVFSVWGPFPYIFYVETVNTLTPAKWSAKTGVARLQLNL